MKIKILSILALLLTMTQGAWADDKADYGMLNGEFSVSAVKKVHFSRGNLRAFYNSSKSWEWYFSTNQWDYVGNAKGNTIINGNGSLSSLEYAVDLFGWSTPAESNFYGINESEDNSVYSNAFLDWSKVTNFRSIFVEGWFTMSNSEWTYLLNSRTTTTTNMPTGTNSDYARYIKAQVASENGLILFPDKYAHPADASVTVSSAAYNTANKGYGSFTVNAENWTKMEEAGAVFLPAGGYRHGTGIIDAGSYGAYWSSTSTSSEKATSMDFSSSKVEAYNTNRSTGCSVRLVIESHSITYNANGGEGEIASQPKYTDLDRTLSDGTGLSREGYIFDGWATAADGAKVYDLGATYTEEADVTLYAHWTPVNDVTWDATDAEKNNWTIDPVNPVAAGAAVIATYNGTRHVKSVTYRPAGTIGGKFTINNSGDKVYFSKGNLQLVDENSWKFADNQWETFGENQSDNHRDLFGWCTVATPNKTSDNYEDYTSDTDWGDDPYLQACIGTGWHLITGGNYGEWNYLLNSRTTTSDIRYAVGSVNGKNGLILLPDDWNAEYYALNNTNKVNGPYGDNVISLSDWTEKLEAHGAVFLPAGGHRIGTKLYVVNDIGHYWCSTRQANGDVMRIDEDLILPNWALDFYYGCSIRLVKAVSSLELTPNAEKTVWTTTMPAYDIELSAEYYDEVTLTDGEAITALNTYTGQEIWVNYTRSFTADKASTVCLPFAYTKKTGDGSFYAFSGIEKVDNEYIATMTEPGTSTLTANTPYLYKAETTGDADFSGTYAIPASITAGTTTSGDWTFIGTYSTIEWTDAPTEPTYGFSAQAANDGITQGQFVKVGSYVRIKPMRAYLQYTGSDSQFANARAAATTSDDTLPETSDDTLPETIGVRLISANGEVTAIGTLYTRTGEVSFDSEAWYTLDGKRLNAKPNTKGIYVNNGKKVVIK